VQLAENNTFKPASDFCIARIHEEVAGGIFQVSFSQLYAAFIYRVHNSSLNCDSGEVANMRATG